MVSFKKITSFLLMPLLYLNLAGLAAGAVWLGSLSQWQVIWLGMLMIFFSPYIIPILIIPAGVFSHFMSLHHSAGQKEKEHRMFLLSLAYLLLFMTLWCAGIFEYVTHSLPPEHLKAALLWADSAALAPLLWWASRDRANTFITTMVETAQAAVLALSLLYVLGFITSFWTACGVVGGILALTAVCQAVYEEKSLKNPSR